MIYFEITSIFEFIIRSFLNKRIQKKLDGPNTIPVSPQVVDPDGREVVVVQPGNIVMMQGSAYPYQYNPYVQNQPQIPVPKAQYPGNNDFQIKEKIS